MPAAILLACALLVLASPTMLSAEEEALVVVHSRQLDENTYELYAENTHIVPIYLVVWLQRARNVTAPFELPYGRLLQPGTRNVPLFNLQRVANDASFSFSIAYRFARGDPNSAQHNDNHIYLFPFANGSKYRVGQGYNGRFSHFGENMYALDFDLPLDTPVHAARGGVVVEAKEDSTIGGPGTQYGEHANLIVIAHDDGSFGSYVHLLHNGALVEPGQRVEAGEVIGRSGNTGHSSGPHLHFDVRVPTTTGEMRSLPTRFLNHDQQTIDVTEGNYYYALHPGGAPFETLFGSDLRPEDFADYRATVDPTQMLQFRSETIDQAYIAYLANGFEQAIEVQITFALSGVNSTLEYPQSIVVPALTELFIGLFHALPQARQVRISPSFRYTPLR